MVWIYIVVIAQLINAVVIFFDRYLVSDRALARPVIYAFYVSILSGAVILLLPFGVVSLPSRTILELSFAVAAAFVFSILFLYKALRTSEASDVAPVTGSATALATLIFSFIWLDNRLPENFAIGFVLLVLGMALLSHLRFSKKAVFFVIISGTLLGASSVLVKMIFLRTDFWNGFFWSRIANIPVALALLAWPGNLSAVVSNLRLGGFSSKFLVVFNKFFAGIAFALILLAIKLGNVSVINALVALQFVFVFIFAFVLGKRLPEYFQETAHHHKEFWHKAVPTAMIIIGFFILFF